MGKRRNLKRRDNEAEGAGSGSDVTLSALENEHDSADESDRGAREDVITRRENVNFEPPNARRERERDERENGMESDHGNEVETDNDGQAEGDATRRQVRGDNQVTTAMKEMTNALVQTIRESNRAINRNINNLLEEVQRRQPTDRMTSVPTQRTGNYTEPGRRPRPNARHMSYSRYDYSESDDEQDMYPLQRQRV